MTFSKQFIEKKLKQESSGAIGWFTGQENRLLIISAFLLQQSVSSMDAFLNQDIHSTAQIFIST